MASLKQYCTGFKLQVTTRKIFEKSQKSRSQAKLQVRSLTMKCKLIYFRLAAEWLAILFFAISGVICLSAYFDSQNLQENKQIILLISGIVHLVLFVFAVLSCSNTTTILGPYIFEDYLIYNEMMELVG